MDTPIHYSNPLLLRFGESAEEKQPRSSAISQTSRFIEIRPTGGFGLISVRIVLRQFWWPIGWATPKLAETLGARGPQRQRSG